MQSFIKTPTSNSHCAVPTFIKLRARKYKCQGRSYRDSAKVSSSQLQRSNGHLPWKYSTLSEGNMRGNSDLLHWVHAQREYSIRNKVGYLFSCSQFSQERLK